MAISLLLEEYAHLFINGNPAHLLITGKLCPSLYFWKTLPISLLLEN